MRKQIKSKKAVKFWNLVTYVVLSATILIFGTVQMLNFKYIGTEQLIQLGILILACLIASLVARLIATIITTIFFKIEYDD